MLVLPINVNKNDITAITPDNGKVCKPFALCKIQDDFIKQGNAVSFQGNLFGNLMRYVKYKHVQRYTDKMAEQFKHFSDKGDILLFKNLSMERLEGLQYGIKAFDGMTMKDIQYLCDNLHVIAVKRGCKNMCGYCYASSTPSNRQMSWEDFTKITNGIKEIRNRLHNLPIFGQNHPIVKEHPIYGVTELFYDADCIDLAIKDKHGQMHDFIDMLNEINSFGRKSCFDTSGWNPQITKLQQRAQKYAQYFSQKDNMDKLEAFNLSFNVFSASNIAAVKALQKEDVQKAQRLKQKYIDRVANAIYTFTPLLESEKFGILTRSFGFNAKNANGFDVEAMINLINGVKQELLSLYKKDLSQTQKYVKTNRDIDKYMALATQKMNMIDTALNSSGRMKQFMETFKITDKMQDHSETLPYIIQDLSQSGRYHRIVGQKLIDTDGKVYHMDYARFIPTDIQLNIEDKSPTPKLANMIDDFKISNDLINQKEVMVDIDDVKINDKK